MVTNRRPCPVTLKIHKKFKIAWKITKPLVLSSTSIFLSLKNELKIFLSIETYEKGEPALKRSLLEPPTLVLRLVKLTSFAGVQDQESYKRQGACLVGLRREIFEDPNPQK